MQGPTCPSLNSSIVSLSPQHLLRTSPFSASTCNTSPLFRIISTCDLTNTTPVQNLRLGIMEHRLQKGIWRQIQLISYCANMPQNMKIAITAWEELQIMVVPHQALPIRLYQEVNKVTHFDLPLYPLKVFVFLYVVRGLVQILLQ